ncbi:MAG: hypothetical protein K0S76_2072 [Herbinix sp.]|nr:hypothetical protein [Herbinix sp.]
MKQYGISLDYHDNKIMKKNVFDASKNYFHYQMQIGNLKVSTTDFMKVLPDKNWKIGEHFHTFYELHVIPSGKGTIYMNDIPFIVEAGQWYMTGPYVKHSQYSDESFPMTEYCIKFEVNVTDTHYDFTPLRDTLSQSYPYAFDDKDHLCTLFDEIFIEATKQDLAYELKIQLLITEIIIHVFRYMKNVSEHEISYKDKIITTQTNRSKTICNFIEENYTKQIKINDLSKVLFLCPKQINRFMLREFGMTFHNYLLQRRVEAATALIKTTNLTLDEIALQTGFSGSNQLYQVFMRNLQCSPGSLR